MASTPCGSACWRNVPSPRRQLPPVEVRFSFPSRVQKLLRVYAMQSLSRESFQPDGESAHSAAEAERVATFGCTVPRVRNMKAATMARKVIRSTAAHIRFVPWQALDLAAMLSLEGRRLRSFDEPLCSCSSCEPPGIADAIGLNVCVRRMPAVEGGVRRSWRVLTCVIVMAVAPPRSFPGMTLPTLKHVLRARGGGGQARWVRHVVV